jgi:quaternary ammonium compound-resistance protein SugE
MSWTLLVISGLLECAWAIGLKQSQGFSKFWPSVFTLVTLAASMGLLALASKELPIGTAYAVWVGIGAMGTALLGIVILNEPVNGPRLLCLAGMAISLIGLKLTSGD